MTKYRQIAWRLIAVVAFTATAALAVTLSRAPAYLVFPSRERNRAARAPAMTSAQ